MTIKVLPTKKGNGLHVSISHTNPPGLHQITLDFVSALMLASQLWREGFKGLVSRDLQMLERWQVERLREAFHSFIKLNQNPLFEQYVVKLLASAQALTDSREID